MVSVHVFMSSVDFFKDQFFRKDVLRIPSECQTVWIHISYQQMTQMGKDNEDNEPMHDDKSFQDDQYIK